MKKSIYLLLLVALSATLFSFVNEAKYPEGISKKAENLFKDHCVKSISNNDDLFAALEFKYPSLIDQVHSVDAQYSSYTGHYYNVFGVKNDKRVMISVKISTAEFQEEILNYDKSRDYSNVEYCYIPVDPQSTCIQVCYRYTFSSCSDPMINCGEWDPVEGCPQL